MGKISAGDQVSSPYEGFHFWYHRDSCSYFRQAWPGSITGIMELLINYGVSLYWQN